jgi:hypothetical protein
MATLVQREQQLFQKGFCTWAKSAINTANADLMMVSPFDPCPMNYESNAFQIGAGMRCIKNN